MDKMLLYKSREELDNMRKNGDCLETEEVSETEERSRSNDEAMKHTPENIEGRQESEETEIQYQRPRREIRRPARFNDFV